MGACLHGVNINSILDHMVKSQSKSHLHTTNLAPLRILYILEIVYTIIAPADYGVLLLKRYCLMVYKY
jgi:hypothetical protein